MNKDEALKMAIEALQNNQTYDWKGNPLTALDEANEKVINACKEALEQPAQEPDYWLGYGLQAHDEKPYDEATPLYLRPAQPLSDDEIKKLAHNNKCWMNAGDNLMFDWEYFARAIEQAHGIGVKNGQTI